MRHTTGAPSDGSAADYQGRMLVPARFTLPLTLAALALPAAAAPAAHAAPTFGAPVTFGVGAGVTDPRSLAVADLDADGRPDLVAGDANGGAGLVTVLLNGGGLTFAEAPGGPYDPDVAGTGVGPIATGDLDGDGSTDVLAALSSGGATDALVPMLGDGAGHLTATAAVTTRAAVTGVALADLDGDGDLDALSSHDTATTADELAVLAHGGAGFALSGSSGAPGTSRAAALAVGQLDGHGGPDALIVSRDAGAGSAWIAASSGLTLVPGLPVPVGADPVAATLADVDRDGDLDALVLDGTDGVLSVLTSDGAGTLTGSAVSVGGLGHGSGLAAGDLDGDAIPDVVVTDDAGDQAGVLLGDGHGGFAPATWLPTGGEPRAPVIADFDGDEVPDLATAEALAGAIAVRRGTGAPLLLGALSAPFASQAVGTTGESRTVTITNRGLGLLHVESVTATGPDADDILITRDRCTGRAIHAVGADACTVDVRFAPTATGPRTAALRVRATIGAPVDVALPGSGLAPATGDTTPPTTPAGAAAAAGEPATAGTPAATTTTTPANATRPVKRTTKKKPEPKRLILTLARTKLAAKRGTPLKVGFALGRDARVILRVKRHGRTVDLLRAKGHEGRGTLTWDGKLGGRPAPAGTYRLDVYAVAADGHAARASATLMLTP
jgi:hypothetical protein